MEPDETIYSAAEVDSTAAFKTPVKTMLAGISIVKAAVDADSIQAAYPAVEGHRKVEAAVT